MRIAHIHWSLATGGIETMLPDIVSEQSKQHDVALFIINDKIERFILSKIDSRVKVYLLNRHEGSKNPWPIIKLNLLLTKFRPDIIHTHAYREINLVFYPYGKRVRTIHNTHNLCSEYPKYNALIAISKAVWDFTKDQGFDSIIAENGITINRVSTKTDNRFKDGKIHFVQVSRLDIEQKGQDILLKALGIIKKKYCKDNFVMHFVGKGGDEELLRQMTIDLGLEENVIFEGLKDQTWIYNNLCKYDLFIQPSRYEGFGLTVTEAVAAKVPVLVSNIEGPMEIIDNGRFGMSFVSENSMDCADQIKAFIENGRDEVLVEKAYKYVVEHYDVAVTAAKYLDVYNSILI